MAAIPAMGGPMIIERVIEIRVRGRCDCCKRNEAVIRKQVAIEAVGASRGDALVVDAVYRAEKELDGVEELTGQKWLMRRGKHICPPCARSIQVLEDAGL